MTINNKLYTIVGDANLEILENIEIVFFNKAMATDRNLDLYKDVKNGDWTLARMLEVSRIAAANLDDTDTANDIYGVLYDVHSLRSQLFSAGLKLAKKGNDGTFNIDDVANVSNVNICDKVTDLFNDHSVNYSDKTARARDWTLFKNSQAMMYATALYLGQSLRSGNLDFDYGILPMPKLDKDSDYISTPYGVSVFAIPQNVTSRHASAMVLNAMSFYSSNGSGNLVETFYDLVLKYQVANSVDDVENLELVRNKVYVDFAFIYDVGVFDCFSNAVKKNVSVTTDLNGKIKAAKRSLVNDFLKFYKD